MNKKLQREFLKLNRSAIIGFDKMFSDLERTIEQNQSFPKYNIVDLGENKFAIELALAGYKIEDLEVELKEQSLFIRTVKTDETSEDSQDEEKNEVSYIHQGIAKRNFERRFQLSEYIQVLGANMENGILTINLEQVIPEEKKPKKIKID